MTNWGTGSPRREFLHVDDMAAACLHLLEHYDGPEQVNVGTGRDATITEIAGVVAEAVGLRGRDRVGHLQARRHPAEAARRLASSRDAGWAAQIGLREGIASTVAWYRAHRDRLREAG